MTEDFTARIQYSKKGLIRFIGHIDTSRAIKRALRASGLPLRFTEGFNPRVKISFGPSLPLGFSSDCEFFDAMLREAVTPAEIKEKLQPRLPQGIIVEKTAIFSHRPSALARIIDHAQYLISLPVECSLSSAAIEKILNPAEIMETDDEKEKSKMLLHIDSLDCNGAEDEKPEYNIILKDINKSAPSVTKIFSLLLNIQLFDTDGARMRRAKLWSERQRIF